MGIVESAQMAQDYYLHQENMTLNQRAFEQDKRSMNMDLVQTLREDLRDLCAQQYSQIDNLMLISTLVLSFSYGFVMEGTFPDTEFYDEGWKWFTPWLCVYSALLAFSIILPFWSMWACLACKNNLDRFLGGILTNEAEKRMELNTWLHHYVSFERYWHDKCEWYYLAAYNFFWAGTVVCFLECAVLCGLNFYHWYEPHIWMIFVGIVVGNMCLALAILAYRGCNRHCGNRQQTRVRRGDTFAHNFGAILERQDQSFDGSEENLSDHEQDALNDFLADATVGSSPFFKKRRAPNNNQTFNSNTITKRGVKNSFSRSRISSDFDS